jgi:hypothetical protein
MSRRLNRCIPLYTFQPFEYPPLSPGIFFWLLLDSRVVVLPRSSNLTVVTLSSLKPFFFNGLKKALPFSDNVGASDPGIQ